MAKIMDIKKLREAQDYLKGAAANISKADPWVPILLGGTEFRLEFSFLAVKNVKRQFGIDLNVAAPSAAELSDPEFVAATLLAGFMQHHPGTFVDTDAVLGKMNPRMLAYYGTTIQVALEAIQPDLSQFTKLMQEAQDGQEDLPLAETKDPATQS